MPAEKIFGYSCWMRGCDATVEAPTQREADIKAGVAGWVLGHYDGQAHYSCPDCKAGLMGVYGPIRPQEAPADRIDLDALKALYKWGARTPGIPDGALDVERWETLLSALPALIAELEALRAELEDELDRSAGYQDLIEQIEAALGLEDQHSIGCGINPQEISALRADRERYTTPHPKSEWHEDYSCALWWRFPICEPPYCGDPGCSDWPFDDDDEVWWTPMVDGNAIHHAIDAARGAQ